MHDPSAILPSAILPGAILFDAIGLYRAGRRGEAAALCRTVLAGEPDHPRALFLSGVLLLDEGRSDAASAVLHRAVAADPAHLGARVNLVRALLASGRFPAALAGADVALETFGGDAELHFMRGTALNAMRRADQAITPLTRAVALDPDHARAWLNLGNACADLDRLEEAERHISRACALEPDLLEAHASLGFVLTSRGRLAEARAACAAAIERAPDYAQAHWNLATAALLEGDFATGFAEYEWRKRHDRFRRDFINLPGPVWNGEPADGLEVLVHAEQGLGDTIQLSRYIPMLATRGARVTLACAPSLLPLLRHVSGLHAAVDKFAPLPAYDLWIDQMSLPRVFATTPDTVPSPEGWLRADPVAAAAIADSLPRDRRIGIVWAGNPEHSNDRRRSLPPDALSRLAEAAGDRLISLQVGPRAAEAGRYGIPEISAGLTEYSATAAAIAELDLLVCVDTSVAHLAGALGRPAWVMLPYAPDWRWMLGRDDTPWYRSLRLFRQPRPGDWASVIDRVADELRDAFLAA